MLSNILRILFRTIQEPHVPVMPWSTRKDRALMRISEISATRGIRFVSTGPFDVVGSFSNRTMQVKHMLTQGQQELFSVSNRVQRGIFKSFKAYGFF